MCTLHTQWREECEEVENKHGNKQRDNMEINDSHEQAQMDVEDSHLMEGDGRRSETCHQMVWKEKDTKLKI